MVQPNADVEPFCDWIQTSGFYRYSPQRLALIELVKQASINVTQVTQVQWNDFIRVTNIVWPAYQQNILLQ